MEARVKWGAEGANRGSWSFPKSKAQGPLSARHPLGAVVVSPTGALVPGGGPPARKWGSSTRHHLFLMLTFPRCQDAPLPGCLLVGDDSELRQPVTFISDASTRVTQCLVLVRSLIQNPLSLCKP